MSYDDDETSIEDSQPRDLFVFALPAVTYRLTSGTRDIVHNGQTYRAGTLTRADIPVGPADRESSLELSIIVSHALPQRYLRGGIPPQQIDVSVLRLQLRSGDAQLVFRGRVTSLACERHVAKIRVVPVAYGALDRRLATITAGRQCPFVLYESGCNVNPAAFTVTRTVVGVDGANVTLDSAPNAIDDWAKWGELVHSSSGERRTIGSQLGAVITMQLPIPDLLHGDSVLVRAGCAHDITDCRDKFDNQVNFGGFPDLPRINPFLPNGYGLYHRD